MPKDYVLKSFGKKRRWSKSRGKSGGRKKTVLNENLTSEPTANFTISNIIADKEVLSPISIEDISLNANEEIPMSVSKRKINYFKSFCQSSCKVNIEANESKPYQGFRLVDLNCISKLFINLLCPDCKDNSLELVEINEKHGKGRGLNTVLAVQCNFCETLFNKTNTSNKISEMNNSSEVNLRTVASSRNSGIGYSKLKSFFSGLNVPPVMHIKTYQNLHNKINIAATKTCSENLTEAAKIVRQLYLTQDTSLSPNNPIPIIISFDGTWQKRGHSSHFGVGIIIELYTGLVLDFEVVSNYCKGCEIGLKPNDKNYISWAAEHKEKCNNNFDGSANAMEPYAAEVMFKRSLAKYNFMYTTMLCDGDSAAFKRVSSLNLYKNFIITKEDCVNHVAKRMYHALATLKKKEPGTGGKGKLTNKLMEKLTGYYAAALKDNAPDVENMKKAVYSSFLHIISTDDEPHHRFCPSGEKSWCHYNRSIATNTPIRPHTPGLPKTIGDKVIHIYDRLTNPDLLERCSRMKTQNANESFNSKLWQRCPKTEFASAKTIITATSLAVIDFNAGPEAFNIVLKNLYIDPGEHQRCSTAKAAKIRMELSSIAASDLAKSTRKHRKLNKARKADHHETTEGKTYEAGGFNT